MARFNGGAKVDGGYYWNPENWEVEVVPEGGATLSASADTTYLKVPLAVALPVSAILGASFMMALPAIGFIVFIGDGLKKLAGKGKVASPGAKH